MLRNASQKRPVFVPAAILAASLATLLAVLFCLAGCAGTLFTEDAMLTPLDPNSPYLLLANKQHPLGASYAPATSARIPANLTLNGKTVEMEAAAAQAAVAMVLDMHGKGYSDIVVTSGYRTYAYQQSLFTTYIGQEQEKHPDWTAAQCEAEVLTYSARPGTSEHQTGLCMDLISTQNVVLDESFAQNPAYAYLTENAHRFGFILRYPQGKEDVTGYTYEPWHYRYVGVEEAERIHAAGLTLEEYLAGD